MDNNIRILLVDDHEVVRVGLRTLLGRQSDMEVVGEARDRDDAIEQASRIKPDLVVMDLRLPGGGGVEAIRKIKKRLPGTRILVLTAFSEEQMILDAIVAGANGHLLKEIDGDKLAAAIRTVASGASLIEHRIMEQALERLRSNQPGQGSTPVDDLTWQETRILSLIADGKSNREIGQELRLSEKTIRNYVSQILGKLGLHSRTQAAAYAIRRQLGAEKFRS